VVQFEVFEAKLKDFGKLERRRKIAMMNNLKEPKLEIV